MKDETDNAIPFERHPLYQEAMQQIVAGDEQGALDTLRRLIERYPKEQALQDLVVRIQLRSTFGGGDYIPVDHSQGTPILRTVVMVMLAVTTVLVVATGLIALYNNYLLPKWNAEARASDVQSQWDKFTSRMEAGDINGAQGALEELATLTPGDASVQESLRLIAHLKQCSDMYHDALDNRNAGNLQLALDLLYQISPDCDQYLDAQREKEDLEQLNTVETAWMQAQNLLEAQDWQGAATILTWIRQEDQEFQGDQVEYLLVDCHRRIAVQLLAEAKGDVAMVREAATHLKEALTIKPGDQNMADEYRLALGYVLGSEAYDRGDWIGAAARWEPLYQMRHDYQNGVLRQRLCDIYPHAAADLVSDASGSVRLLTLAVDYYDQALTCDPGNESFQQERMLAVEYLAGNEAHLGMDYDLAIAHWGPIHVLRPDYQNNVLEEKLREACTLSLAPDAEYCAP